MEEMQKKVSNVMKTGEVTPLRTHMLPVLLTLSVFFSSSSLVPVPSAPVMYGFFLQWLFQSAARDVINFIHTLWMLCLGKKKSRR